MTTIYNKQMNFKNKIDMPLEILKKIFYFIFFISITSYSQESLDELLEKTESLITIGELAIRSLSLPGGDYQVQYENGVRKMIPV